MTDIELRNENGKIVGYDSDGNKVPISFEDTDHESLNANYTFTGGVTMFVDAANGSDSNDGLSSAEPKATIQSAIADAPIHGAGDSVLVLDLAAGTYSSITGGAVCNLRDVSLAGVKLKGKTDGSGNPAVTLDASGSSYALLAKHIDFETQDVELKGGGNPLNLLYNAHGTLKNTNVVATSDTNYCTYAQLGSSIDIQSDCTHDLSATTQDASWVVAVTGAASGRLSGTYTGDGSTNVVLAKEEAWVYTRSGATIDAAGGEYAMRCQMNSDIKVGETTIQNATVGMFAEGSSFIRESGPVTTSSLSHRYDGSGFSTIETEDGRELFFPSSNDNDPNVSDVRVPLGVMSASGNTDATGLLQYRSTTFGSWLEMGRQEFASGSATITAGTAQVVETLSNQNPSSYQFIVSWAKDPDTAAPSSDATVKKYRNITSGGTVEFVFEETSGASDIDIEYTIWTLK